MEITKREVLASVSIVAAMLLIGLLISGKIQNSIMDDNERYNKAVKIENEELFQYGIDTNVGDAFVYGDLEAVDTVTYPEIGGELQISYAWNAPRYRKGFQNMCHSEVSHNSHFRVL